MGKWDAGMATKDHTPLGRGFDSSFGYFHHANDYYTKGIGMRVSLTYGKLTIQQQERMEQPMKKVSLRNTCLMWSTTMIPPSHVLFLYYAPHIVHAPLQVPEKYLNMFSFIDDHDRQYYHANGNLPGWSCW